MLLQVLRYPIAVPKMFSLLLEPNLCTWGALSGSVLWEIAHYMCTVHPGAGNGVICTAGQGAMCMGAPGVRTDHSKSLLQPSPIPTVPITGRAKMAEPLFGALWKLPLCS